MAYFSALDISSWPQHLSPDFNRINRDHFSWLGRTSLSGKKRIVPYPTWWKLPVQPPFKCPLPSSISRGALNSIWCWSFISQLWCKCIKRYGQENFLCSSKEPDSYYYGPNSFFCLSNNLCPPMPRRGLLNCRSCWSGVCKLRGLRNGIALHLLTNICRCLAGHCCSALLVFWCPGLQLLSNSWPLHRFCPVQLAIPLSNTVLARESNLILICYGLSSLIGYYS